jgi:hypothetical protein
MGGAPRYRKRTHAFVCKWCGRPGLAASPKRQVCDDPVCERMQKQACAQQRERAQRLGLQLAAAAAAAEEEKADGTS